ILAFAEKVTGATPRRTDETELFEIEAEISSSMAVDSTTYDHALPNNLGKRHNLTRAVSVASMTVDITPQDHPDRAGRLRNLGTWLGRRFERTGLMDDLNCIIDVASMAADSIPYDHPDRAGQLNSLGTWLGRRFERTG